MRHLVIAMPCVQIRFVQVSIVHSILHSGLVHNTNVDNANMKMQADFFDGGKLGLAKSTSTPLHPWAARYYTWLLIELMPKGVVFPFLFFF